MPEQKKLNRYWLILLLIASPSPGLTQTDVYLRVYTKTFQRMEIDLFAFAGDSRNGQSNDFSNLIRDVLSNDLWMSGYFKVNIRSGMPENTSRDGHTANSTDRAKSLARITGTFRFDNNGFMISPTLIDNASDRTIIRNDHHGRPGTERAAIHKIADDIVYSLTGERGIARSKIAFVAQGKDGAKEIGMMDYDGYGSTILTSDKSINLSPAWSPDGDQICYTSYKSDNPDLYVRNLRTGSEIRLSNVKGLNSAPAWSPDGSKIALTLSKDGNAEIYLFDIERKKLRRLTYNRAIDSSPTWSPSNREIAFTSDRLGSPQVYIMDADGIDVRRLTYEGSYNDSPAWSPRGDKIVFVSRTDSGFDIYTIDVTGENLMRLTDSSGSNEDPSWSPNGFSLVFSSTRSGSKKLYSMFWDGSDQKNLTTSSIRYSPAWSPRLK